MLLALALGAARRAAPRAIAPLVAVLTAGMALATTAAAFDRLFTRMGIAGRPVGVNQGIIFTWIDQQVPAGAHGIAMLPYQTTPATSGRAPRAWWDAEFWNERSTAR